MKLRQRYVIAFGIAVSSVVTFCLVLGVLHKDSLYNTVWEVQGAIGGKFLTGPHPEPNTFVRQLTAEEFRQNALFLTGNPLIDDYGENDPYAPGENGVPVVLPDNTKANATFALEKFHVNVLVSDVIPLNRKVPDSRFPGCAGRLYPHDLPTVSIILPFHDEWPSVLLRTLYSVINRTPRHLLWEIILVDDGSTLESLKGELDTYISTMFPVGLIKIIHLEKRIGLIRARMKGVRMATGEVLVILDSHMEVNVQWLEPLLLQIKQDRKSVALGILDYIHTKTFLYDWHKDYLTRYGFDWRLVFYETFFRPDLYGADDTVPKQGVVMVGTGFAVDRKYFLELGGYDEGMDVWGGENLELSWRVWMCGGSLIHIPCSKLGHIARAQPYSFPEGRRQIEVHNYKRAVEVWMEDNHKSFIYDYFPDMKAADPGDLTERKDLKTRLGCKNFSWFLDNIWPELTVFDKDAFAWGSVRNNATGLCLDNHSFLFTSEEPLYADTCHGMLNTQGFTLTRQGLLRSSLQCVVVKENSTGAPAKLETCVNGPADKWSYPKVNEHLRHERTGMCLDLCDGTRPCVKSCTTVITQMWTFDRRPLVA